MRQVAVFILVIVLAISLSTNLIDFNSVEAANSPILSSWTTLESMPTARFALGVVAVNEKIYAIGGIDSNFILTDVNEMYDPLTNTWTTLQPMPTARSYFAIAGYQNKIYCFGGITGSNYYETGITEVYNTETDTWTQTVSMPTPRFMLCANMVNDKIYLIGGAQERNAYMTVNVNEAFDPHTNTWTTMTPPSTAVYSYASAVVNNKIYLISGYGSSVTQVYSHKTDTWTYETPAPTVVYGGAAATTVGDYAPQKIYLFGSTDGLFSYNTSKVYDLKTRTWDDGVSLPAPSSGLGVVNVDDLLYIVGGMGTTVTMPPVSKTARFTPADYGTVAPVVNITSPTNDAIYVENSLPLTFTINRPSDQITQLSYSLDDNARIDIAGNVTLSNLPNGAHTIKVYVETQHSSVVGEYFASSYADTQFIISALTPTSSLIPTISNPVITKSPSQSPSLTISPTPTVTAPNNNLPIDTLVYWIVVIFAVIAISIAAVTLILKTRHKR